MSGDGGGTDDRAARFVPLYEAYYPRVAAYARRRTSAQQADDVAADTFSIAWRRLDAVPEGERALAWLYGVARRVLSDQRRADLRRRRLVTRLGSLPWDYGPPEEHVGDPNATRALRKAMGSLQAGDREILWLNTWRGLSNREIAARIGCSANAVAVRLHRARRRLADRLWQDHVTDR